MSEESAREARLNLIAIGSTSGARANSFLDSNVSSPFLQFPSPLPASWVGRAQVGVNVRNRHRSGFLPWPANDSGNEPDKRKKMNFETRAGLSRRRNKTPRDLRVESLEPRMLL